MTGDSLDKVEWPQLRVGDSIGKNQVALVTGVGLVIRSGSAHVPDGLLLPLASRYGEGRVNTVIRAQVCPKCYCASIDGRAHPSCTGTRELTPQEVFEMAATEFAGVELVGDWDRQDTKFGPWPEAFRGIEISVFDYETTGLDPERGDRPVELAAVAMDETGIIDSFSSFINPGIPIPREATAIHGITDAMVADAPDEEHVLNQFASFLIGTDAIAGHNVNFDRKFFKSGADRFGIDLPKLKRIDTLEYARTLLPRGRTAGKVTNHKLTTLTAFFGIEHGSAHRALDDTIATAKLLNKLLVMMESGSE